MASISLSDLPNEVLCNIFQQFCLHCRGEHDQPSTIGTLSLHEQELRDQRGERKEGDASRYSEHYRLPLCSLSLTSKRFRDIAQPILHHEFVLGHGDSWKLEGSAWKKRLIHFMRTMRQRRDPAKLVKVASVHSRLITWIENQDARRAFLANSDAMYIDLPSLWTERAKKGISNQPSHFNYFRKALFDHGQGLEARAKESVGKRYEPHYGHGDHWLMSQLVAMLLALLPNLEHFSTRECRPILGESPGSSLADLQLLHLPVKTLDLETWFSPLVELASSLETLNIRGSWHSESSVPKMPNLKVLRLEPNFSISPFRYLKESPSFLQDILLACTGGLRTFAFEAPRAGGHRKYLDTGHPELGRVLNLLHNHQKTLNCLHLDIRRVILPRVREYLHPDLTDFTSLEHLLLSSDALPISPKDTKDYQFFNQKLPPSIKSLSFPVSRSINDPSLEKEIHWLAWSKTLEPTLLPNLRQVICDIEHPISDDVANKFGQVGVKFGYKLWNRFERTIGDKVYRSHFERGISRPASRSDYR
ncbi:hypothetical protein B0J13DRAFT_446790 [Dactylonectria estremocensis]|uniref:Uncharacterized protein n=1 Tax=Dactylonectria estremocensis TaxID=1079267 RepID=A0A9P9EM03_9HYPO|nr:hypothetical protein B0J13DRAFT_446790 [Dactylonectria estremocensis]